MRPPLLHSTKKNVDAQSYQHKRHEDVSGMFDCAPDSRMIADRAAYAIVRDTEAEVKRELERVTNVKQFAAGYENYQQWLAGTRLEQQVSLEDYSVSNRGLRSGLVGTPDQVASRVAEFEDAGVDLLLLQCSPQLEEMERFAETVIAFDRCISVA